MCGKTFWKTVIVLFVLLAFNQNLAEAIYDFGGEKAVDLKMIHPLLLPERISKQQADLRQSKTELAKFEKPYCVIQNDDGTPYWFC